MASHVVQIDSLEHAKNVLKHMRASKSSRNAYQAIDSAAPVFQVSTSFTKESGLEESDQLEEFNKVVRLSKQEITYAKMQKAQEHLQLNHGNYGDNDYMLYGNEDITIRNKQKETMSESAEDDLGMNPGLSYAMQQRLGKGAPQIQQSSQSLQKDEGKVTMPTDEDDSDDDFLFDEEDDHGNCIKTDKSSVAKTLSAGFVIKKNKKKDGSSPHRNSTFDPMNSLSQASSTSTRRSANPVMRYKQDKLLGHQYNNDYSHLDDMDMGNHYDGDEDLNYPTYEDPSWPNDQSTIGMNDPTSNRPIYVHDGAPLVPGADLDTFEYGEKPVDHAGGGFEDDLHRRSTQDLNAVSMTSVSKMATDNKMQALKTSKYSTGGINRSGVYEERPEKLNIVDKSTIVKNGIVLRKGGGVFIRPAGRSKLRK